MRPKAYIRRHREGHRFVWGGVIRDEETGRPEAAIPSVATWQEAMRNAEIIMRNLSDPNLIPRGPRAFPDSHVTRGKVGPGPYGHPPGPASWDGLYDRRYEQSLRR